MHLLFTPSEAPLSSILQNWKKLLMFDYCLAKLQTNFECVILILHTLNYNTVHPSGVRHKNFFSLKSP